MACSLEASSNPAKRRDEPFVTFSQQLAPLKSSTAYAVGEIQKVYAAIEPYSYFKYARKAIVGGAEHKTSIWVKMDYDFAVFVNPESVMSHWPAVKWPQRDIGDNLDRIEEEVRQDWARFMKPNGTISGTEAKVFKHQDPWRVELEFCGGEFSGDLLIGVNADARYSMLNFMVPEGLVADAQANNMLRLLEGLNYDRKKAIALKKIYSVSVMQRAITSVENKPAQAHEVARLAKFWARFCCPLPHKVRGRSYIIAIVAADGIGYTKQLHLDLFKRFLTRMTKPEELSIDDSVGFNERKARNCVMDPGNCFDNYLEGITALDQNNMRGFLSLCRHMAQQTLIFIRNYEEKTSPTWRDLADVFDMQRAFERHGLKHVLISYLFDVRIIENGCYFPRLTSLSQSGLRKEAKKVMFLVCCAAAFIPRITVDRPTPPYNFLLSLTSLLKDEYKFQLSSTAQDRVLAYSFQFPVAANYGVSVRVFRL